MRRLPKRRVVTAAAAAAVTVIAGLQPAAAAPNAPTPAPAAGGTHPVATARHDALPAFARAKMHGLKTGGTGSTGSTAVFVRFAGDGAATVSARTQHSTPGSASTRASKARSAALARRSEVRAHAASALTAARGVDRKARALFTVTNAVPGLGMIADQAALQALAERSDVVSISAIVPKTASNAYPAQLTRVLDTWQNTGTLGNGVTVGIIDTGLDYTHQDFGGNGDYAAAKAEASNPLYDWRAAQPAALQAKVAGGYDFVGDDYNADPTSASYQPVPNPDPNPLDCNEHGTHVAGTVAGYGENADGSTFTGDYSALTADDLNTMKIGPGMAPAATLYSLKVFGCEGSTDLVIPALDMALDPNNDGNFADHLDIVNLSLGSDYAPVDDPENDVVDQLAANGVLPVIAMGNNGDLTDTGGAPGNAVRSLAVASSVDAMQQRDGLQLNTPVSKIVAGQMSVAYPWPTAAPVTGDVVTMPGASVTDPVTNNADGCQAFTDSQKAAVTGKVVLLVWDDNDATRRCGSAGRSGNAKAAGAIGAVFTSTLDVFNAGITGDPDIPVFQVPKASTQELWDDATAGTLNVTFDGSLQATIKDLNPSINDLISSFSSRGPHGSIGVVKPDVAAPGDTIASAGMGTGDGVLVISGTSMATPHTAGIGALVRAAHPDWTPEQVKAAIMNNANHDLYTGEDRSGDIYGPLRDGAGRVDALSAVQTSVLAYDVNTPGAVSASFGVIEAPIAGGPISRTQTVRVQNTGAGDATFDVSYAAAVSQPGVSYSFRPSSITVPAHTAGTVQVTVTVDPTQLRHTIDPTMDVNQLGVPRQFVSDASGRMLLTDSGSGQVLRVPLYTAAKPVSSMSASGAYTAGHGVLHLTGDGFAEGTAPSDYTSLVSVMDLGATSPKLPACSPDATVVNGCTLNRTAAGGDIQYVGAGVSKSGGTLTDGWLWFGVSTYGDNAALGENVIPYVNIDTTGDGTPDYQAFVQDVSGSDVLVSFLVDLHTGDVVDAEPVNTAFGDLDTNVFDTDALLIPVWPRAIGVTDSTKTFPITYQVNTYSPYGSPALGGDIDEAPTVSYDALNPKVETAGPLWVDMPGQLPLEVARPRSKALVLHLHNGSGSRAQVVTFPAGKAGAPGKVNAKPGNGKVALTWATPTDVGAGPITGYAVRYSADNGKSWKNTSTWTHSRAVLSAAVYGLANGTRYLFDVAAINAGGTGAWSAPVAATPVKDRTAINIGATPTIAKGKQAEIVAKVIDTTTGTPLRVLISLQTRTSDTAAWQTVTTRATAAADGKATVMLTLTRTTQVRWDYAGNARHDAADSASRTVTVTS